MDLHSIPASTAPGGFYQTVHDGDRFQAVNAGAFLSLQRHHHRAEHWVVVNGVAEVTQDDDTFVLHEKKRVRVPSAPIGSPAGKSQQSATEPDRSSVR